MKKFKIFTKPKNTYYVVSRSNSAYGFFKSEYHKLPEVNDTIIIPAQEIEDRTVENEPKGRKRK